MKTEKMKDSHGFEIKKRRFSFRLFIKFILTFALCVYALYRCSLRACAEDIDNTAVRLTPEQTLALYGTNITARRFEQDTNSPLNDIDVTFNYFGCTADYVGSGSYGQNFPVLAVNGVSSNNQTYFTTLLQSAPYLVYTYQTNHYTFYSGLRFLFNLQPRLSGISNYDGNFLFSVGGYQYPYQFLQQSSALFTTSAGVKSFSTEMGPSYNAVVQTYNEAVPAFGQTSDEHIVSCTFTSMYAENAVYFANERFNLENIALSWKSAGGTSWSGVAGYQVTFYLFIQCPEIWNYVPPVVTTAATTRRDYTVLPPQSTAAQQTVDLSNLESGVAAIVEQGVEANNNLDWIGSNLYIGVNNLAYICNRLDDIYAKMWALGEIELTDGLQPPSFENLREFAASAFATQGTNTFTTTRYNMQQDFSVYFDIGNSLLQSSIFRPFLLVAVVGLGLAVLSFILYRGH